jgi:transposase InsO family protein
VAALGVSERRACQVLGQHRSVQRHAAKPRPDEEALTAAVVGLASAYGRYGYRRVTALLRAAGWRVNAKRVERSTAALSMAARGAQGAARAAQAGPALARRRLVRAAAAGAPEPRLGLRLDFVQDRTRDGRVLRMLAVVDAFSRECLAIRVGRRLGSEEEVLEVLAELFVRHGPPEHLRSDNGPEFAASAVRAVRAWLGRLGVGTLFIEPGGPWENGYGESLNGKLRDELLDREVFHSLRRG